VITPYLLRTAIGSTAEHAAIYAHPISEACARFEINTAERLAMFLANVGHESGSLRYTSEIWGPTDAQRRYEGRRDLGNTEPGDGERYKGHGLIQTTGRANHRELQAALLLAGYEEVPDFEGDPEALTRPRWAAASAGYYWASRGLNRFADAGDFDGVCDRINRGRKTEAVGDSNGYADRLQRLARARLAIASMQPEAPIAAPAQPAPAPAPAQPARSIPAGEFIPEETTMAPFIAAAIPSLIQAAPALIRIFGDSPAAERNAKAAEVVASLAQEVTAEATVEGAVRAIEFDPAKAAAFREAVHENIAQLLGLMVQAVDVDEKTRASAVDRALALGKATGGKWLWLLGMAAAAIILFALAATWQVLFGDKKFSEAVQMLLLGQVVLAGFATVLAFLFGTNLQNRVSQREQQRDGQ
jgi:putative chitinase